MLNYKLRPHHALCLSFFEGKGYSNEFVENMAIIYSSLKKEDQITVTFGEDTICQKCPNMKDSLCSSQSKVYKYDEQVAKACRFKKDQVLTYGEFLQTTYEQIISKRQLVNICSDCEWYDICKIKEEANVQSSR